MLLAAIGPMLAEASRIPQTLSCLAIGIHMQIYALRITALPIFGIEPAFRHLLQIVFMQEFTGVTFLA